MMFNATLLSLRLDIVFVKWRLENQKRLQKVGSAETAAPWLYDFER